MSLGRLSIKTRLELETRVLAAALKLSLQSGDLAGARLVHEQLNKIIKSAQDPAGDKADVNTESHVQAVPPGSQPVQAVSPPVHAESQSAVATVQPTQPAQSAKAEVMPEISPQRENQAQPEHTGAQPPAESEVPQSIPASQAANAQSPQPEQSTQPTQPMPTAADALHRSIVNTPMRASHNNMPAVRSIDPDVLMSATPSQSASEHSQRLSESLAKIEAAMNGTPEQPLPTTIEGNGAQGIRDDGPIVHDEARGVEPQYQALYRLLGVSQMSPYEEIHKNFLVRVRARIRQINQAKRPERQELLQSLRKIWIAHDILTDPVTRTDYDFRDLGLRGDVEVFVPPTPEDKQQQQQTNRTPTRIGELLQCAGLLEAAELQIACDMHKAMPEVQFGTFLIKQGFIGERDLESVLLGQKLLRAGVISVAQFQVAMELSQSRGLTISDTLVDRGYVTEEGLAKVVEELNAPPVVSLPPPIVISAAPPEPQEKGPGLSAALMPKITDLVDFEPMEKSANSNNALADLLGGGGANSEGGSNTPAASAVSAPSAAPQASPPVPQISQQTQTAAPPTLNLSQAIPSWKDQLDWDAPEDEIPPPQPIPESMTEPEPANNIPAVRELDPNRTSQLNLGRAVPSWRDQLDWGAPEEEEKKEVTEVAQPSSEDVDSKQPEKEEVDDSDWPIDLTPPAKHTPEVTPAGSEEQTQDSEQNQARSHEPDSEPESAAGAGEKLEDYFDHDNLPGDDWLDIDPTHQMETAAHLEPITMDSLTLKQGKSSRKKDKKKNKNQH
ncbi:MAG TPA: hypothetical protein V6C86_20875 [Oculatellaceae cyanobacterium]